MFRAFFTIFVVFSVFLSCNSEKPDNSNNDTDILPDVTTEDDAGSDLSPDLKQDSDIIEINDNDVDLDSKDDVEIKDEDVESDESTDEKPDTSPDDTENPDYDYPAGTEGDPDCPSLLNAGFPYEDKDGKITFCRKCDLPAPENDPQCVRNLWEMNNRRIMEEYPEYYCYPLPCDVTEKAIKNDAPTIGKCDFEAESKIYHGSTGVFKQGDIWEGKIGMYATAGKEIDGKYIVKGSLLYDIEKKEYTMVSKGTIITVIAGLIYLVNPVDIVPDFLLGGFLDDAAVIGYIVSKLKGEIQRYNEWKKLQ